MCQFIFNRPALQCTRGVPEPHPAIHESLLFLSGTVIFGQGDFLFADMFHIVVTSVCIISGFHGVLGLISVVLGVIASIKAEVWLAHSVSPIWSGGFFIITGILGIMCARKKTSYVIMCFTAFSVVSMVVAVVSIQLLRLGLVNHTVDGSTFQKEKKDVLIIVSLVTAGCEILVCLVSTLLSCRMAKVAKEEMCKRREGMFHVKDDADENGNDVTPNACACEPTAVSTVETVEIHVLDENGVEIKTIPSATEIEGNLSYIESVHSQDIELQEIYCFEERQAPDFGQDFSFSFHPGN